MNKFKYLAKVIGFANKTKIENQAIEEELNGIKTTWFFQVAQE